MSTEDKAVKKSVVRERQRIADEVLKLNRQYPGHQQTTRVAWDAIFPGVELRDSEGRTL